MLKPFKTSRPRPYWHVDFKWLFGILLVLALSATLLLFNLSKLTQRDQAIELSGTIVASLFSKDGLDDESGVAEFRQKATAIPGDVITPIEQFPQLTISKEQALTLSPRDLRVAIFSTLTRVIYDKGVDGAAAEFTNNAADKNQFKKNATLLGVFTNATHNFLKQAFLICLLISIVCAIAVIYFSAGWGRLVSPGLILLLVSPVGALAGLLMLHPPRDGDSPLANLPPSVATEIGNSLSQSYLVAAGTGVFLLLSAGVGKLIRSFIKRQAALNKTR